MWYDYDSPKYRIKKIIISKKIKIKYNKTFAMSATISNKFQYIFIQGVPNSTDEFREEIVNNKSFTNFQVSFSLKQY